MEITACPACGSKNIGIGTLGDGIISGLSSWNEVCRNCGYQGASLVFESETEYKKFLEALSSQKKQVESIVGDTNKEENRKESDHLKERQSEKKGYLFEFVFAIILSVVFFIILFGSQYLRTDVFSNADSSPFLVFLLGSFGAVIIFFFLLIVLVEIMYRMIQKKSK